MKPDARYAVQMSGIVKTFGTFTALDHVDLTVQKGTIHAVLGENGAGKSTLMNVLYGLYQADEGQICLNGEPVVINTPNDAIAHGIGMVHQHFMLVDNFTVTQNIVLGSEVCGAAGILDMKKAREKVCQIIEQYGLEVDPDAKIEDISVGMQQRVEILKALYRGADILILDEPTAVLTPQEIDRLIQIMHDLTSAGKTIIVITHEMAVIEEICQRVAIIDSSRIAEVGAVDDVFTRPQSAMAKQLIYPDGKRRALATGKRYCRIVFDGNSSFEPIVSNMVLECKAPVNIMFADTKNIDGKAYGQMILQLPEDERAAKRALAYLETQNVHTEEVDANAAV